MSNDALSTATYAAILKDLRAKREAIDRAIEALEASNLAGQGDATAPKHQRPTPPKEVASMMPGDACVWLLRERGVPMTNREILDGLHAIGYRKVKATDNINSALRYRAENERDVVRDGKHWRYVGKPAVVVPAPQAMSVAAPAAPQPRPQPVQPAAAAAKPAPAPAPQKGTPSSSANGASALR